MKVVSCITPGASQNQPLAARTGCVSKLLPLLLALPLSVQAQFQFTTNNGAITITKYTGPGGAVTIPSDTNGLPVTAIGTNAFELYFSMTSVVIPNSITNIGTSAFNDTGLISVTIPDSVVSMGNNAFNSSYYLQSVTIGNNLGNIGSYTFQFRRNLTNVMIGSGVTNIGDHAFWSCTSLP